MYGNLPGKWEKVEEEDGEERAEQWREIIDVLSVCPIWTLVREE